MPFKKRIKERMCSERTPGRLPLEDTLENNPKDTLEGTPKYPIGRHPKSSDSLEGHPETNDSHLVVD
jgi:hypothetical protein